MKKTVILCATAAIVLSMSNCTINPPNSLKASKHITTEVRKVKDFDEIEVGGAFEVDITYGSKELVEVEAPDNFQEFIDLSVSSGTLKIEMDDINSYNSQGAVKIHIKTTKLNDFTLSGATSIYLNNRLKDDELSINSSGAASFDGEVKVDNAEIELSGASKVYLTGSAKSADINLSGASKLKDYDFEVKDLDVEISGASTANITSLKSIEGGVSGASSLVYDGNPSMKKVDVSGAAELDRR